LDIWLDTWDLGHDADHKKSVAQYFGTLAMSMPFIYLFVKTADKYSIICGKHVQTMVKHVRMKANTNIKTDRV
jgi:hypothetical protein